MPIALRPGEHREIILDCDEKLADPTVFIGQVASKEQERRLLDAHDDMTTTELVDLICTELLVGWRNWVDSKGIPIPDDTPVVEAIYFLNQNDRADLATKLQRRGMSPKDVEKSE